MALSRRSTGFRLALAAVLVLCGRVPVRACPFCPQATLTLAEQMEQADAVLQVIWKESRKGFAGVGGVTIYEITKIVKAPQGLLSVGGKVKLPAYRAGNEGDKFLLFGTQLAAIEWGTPLEITDAAFEYIVNIPARTLSSERRLPYFLKHLQHENQLIANDAFGEFSNAPYEDIIKVTEQIPREKVRRWIADKETLPTRLGLYGLLLGLSGNSDDAVVLLRKINEPTNDFRLGIDGIMSGYLLIAGDEGLKTLETSKLNGKDVPFSETYAAMQALRFIWKYEPDRMSKDRLRQSMRILLERPELADLVIADLARWEDWAVIDRLIAMYDDEDFNIPSIRRSIVRYLHECQRQSENVVGDPPAPAVKAAAALERIQQKDPKLYRDALRFVQPR